MCVGDDNTTDPFEEMWHDETEEAENDVMSLTLSFLTVNAWRFLIIQCMPNSEGKEEVPSCPEGSLFAHSSLDKVLLWGSAFFFTGVVFSLHYYLPVGKWDSTSLPVSPQVAQRIAEDVVASASMCFSWCTFYGIQMVLAGHSIFASEADAELLSVVLALFCSLGSFALMLPLDWLADQDWTDDRCDSGIRATMDAFALLVGFAWEQCFDTSVDALAHATDNPHRSKFVLSIFCAGLLVPAWKWYMLPYILKKGWRFGYVTQPGDLEVIFRQMHEEHEASGADPEDSETIRLIAKLHSSHVVPLSNGNAVGYQPPTLADTAALGSPGAPGQPAVEAELLSDKPLTAKEAVALRRRVIDLQASLVKAEKDRDNAQNVVAYQMEAMLENMKKLNLTVTRIP